MNSYYVVVVLDTDEEFPVLKGKGATLDNAKELAAMVGNGGYLHKLTSELDVTSAESFEYYPPRRINKIKILPELIIGA